MKHLFFSLLLTLISAASFAQNTIKIYRAGDQVGVRATLVKGVYAPSDVSVTGVGNAINVRVGGYSALYELANFQNASGAAYGVTVDAALSAYEAAVPSGGSGSGGTVTPAPATFGATAPASADYTTTQSIPTTNVLKILIENVGTSSATFTYSGLSYTFVQGDQRVFDAVYDATSNKLIPIASLTINPSASATIRVTRFLKQ